LRKQVGAVEKQVRTKKRQKGGGEKSWESFVEREKNERIGKVTLQGGLTKTMNGGKKGGQGREKKRSRVGQGGGRKTLGRTGTQ